MIQDGEGSRYHEGVFTFSLVFPRGLALGRMAWNGSTDAGE